MRHKTSITNRLNRLTLAVAAALACGLLTTTEGAAEPNLLIPESAFDFGYAPQKSKLSHVFWLKSTGDETLVIEKVVPGCGCTKAPLSKTHIAPGDSAKLEIIFDTRTSRSKVSKRPKIFIKGSDLPRSVQITSSVMADPKLAHPLVAEPYKLDVSQYGEKSRRSIEFELSNVSSTVQRIEVIDLQRDFFDLELPKSVSPGETVSGRLSVKVDKQSESFEKSLTLAIFSEGTDKPVRMTLPITRTVRILSSTDSGK
jgi:Protein of unknown function (DUF1573)